MLAQVLIVRYEEMALAEDGLDTKRAFPKIVKMLYYFRLIKNQDI